MMEPMIQRDGEEDRISPSLGEQVGVVLLHTAVALMAWAVLIAGGYTLNRPQIAQGLILTLSLFVPLVVGFVFNYFRQDRLATSIWLIGLIWFLIIAIRVLDLPTGPNACFQCDATDKITRTFFSYPSPSGLIDNDGPIFATWPVAALVGYSIGARLALRRKEEEED
jgi:hypothetical protein